MSKVKMILGVVIVIIVAVIGISILSNTPDETPDTPNDQETDIPVEPEPEPEPEPELEPAVSRFDKIPSDATKITPEMDNNPPMLHSFLWEDPVILPGGINTAGAARKH
jgi:hypothetical protein